MASASRTLITLLVAASAIACVSAKGSCQITCNTLTATSINSWKPGCEADGATFTQVSSTVAKCYGNLGCTDQNSITSCNNLATGFNNDLSGSSGCVASLVDCDDDKKCFPAHATVELVNGTILRMDQLSVGDKVLVNAKKEYSDVYMFSHRLSATQSEFVSVATEAGHKLMLTGNHYLYVNGHLAVASSIKVGDKLQSKDGAAVAVTGVSTAQAAGLFNPNTLDGDIVVDGIVTSTYTADINPSLAHAALWPVRMAYKLGVDVIGHAFDGGSEILAQIMPDGKARY